MNTPSRPDDPTFGPTAAGVGVSNSPAALAFGETQTDRVSALTSLVFSALFIATLIRFGVVAVATAWFVFFLMSQGPLTADFTRVYSATAGWLIGIVAAITGYAFWASRSGAPLLGRLMPHD